MNKINVLDKGYVRLITNKDDDLQVVNNARVSYDRESEKLDDRDKGLISFLGNAEPEHSEPFYHPILHFEVYAPLMIARQWWKYITGQTHDDSRQQDPFLAWSESSRRYVTENEEFYIPDIDEWRSYPDNVKQGSGKPINEDYGYILTDVLKEHIFRSVNMYETAMKRGVAPEQARLFLPAYGMYVRWRWTSSLKGVAHLINQRNHPDAQYEFQLYAQAVQELTKKEYPYSLKALTDKYDEKVKLATENRRYKNTLKKMLQSNLTDEERDELEKELLK